MTLQIVALDDADPGEAFDAGITVDPTTITTSKTINANDITIGEKFIVSAISNPPLSGLMAISLETTYQGFTTNDVAQLHLSIADGQEGQQLMLKLEKYDVNDCIITPDNFSDGLLVVFSKTGDSMFLVFSGGSWNMIGDTAGMVV